MIVNNVEYYVFRDNDWHLAHTVVVKGFIGLVIPTVGVIMQIPSLVCDYKVTGVRFNLVHNDVEVEMVELWGTGR
jgi:hypothetical protein